MKHDDSKVKTHGTKQYSKYVARIKIKTASLPLIYLIQSADVGAPTFSVNIRDGSFNNFEVRLCADDDVSFPNSR